MPVKLHILPENVFEMESFLCQILEPWVNIWYLQIIIPLYVPVNPKMQQKWRAKWFVGNFIADF